ncbi:MAG: hypothetical protein ACYDH6_14000 [Acidimicrobiales bacterium]
MPDTAPPPGAAVVALDELALDELALELFELLLQPATIAPQAMSTATIPVRAIWSLLELLVRGP